MSKLTAAVIQMNSGVDVETNIETMRNLTREAAALGADYIQTPEMTGLVQQERQAFFNAITDDAADPVRKAASALARELGVTVHVGSTPVRTGELRAANRAYIFGPTGALLARYDKIHMFDVDLDGGESWRESAVYDPGQKAVIVQAAGAQIGMGICYDCRFPELHTSYAKAGVEVLTGPSCFTRQTGEAHWHVLLRSRAIETGSFMIAAAQGGRHEDGRETYGHSIIINPWGKILAEVDNDQPGIAVAEIDLSEVASARAKIPNLANGRAFALDDLRSSEEKVA